jgi:hypothetical protein
MEIIHHLCVHSNSIEFYNAIIGMEIKHELSPFPASDAKLLSFDISESDSRWEIVFLLLKKYQGFDIYHGGDQFDTFFSEEEIRNAEWLRLVSTFEQGYPQPSGNWPIKQLSLTNVCQECAIYEQTNPMRFYKEPGLGKKSFMSLIALRELFATPEVFSTFEEIGATGYEARDVIIHHTKQPSEKVRQLYPLRVTLPGLIGTEQMRQVVCQKCGTIKYYSHEKGVMYLKRDTLIPDVDFMRTCEWFGVGYIAYREIIVSKRIAKLILDNNWQGARLKVIELV